MKILFIGNSYTYYNNMPSIFASLCQEHGIDVWIDSITKGGYSLASYLDMTDVFGNALVKKLKAEKFDYVVLQEQSVRPASEPERFFASVHELCRMIKANGAKILFYETWGRCDGHEVLEIHGWTHEEMLRRLRIAYEKAAIVNDGNVVYAGDAIQKAYRGKEGESVFNADGSHPSLIGSTIVANTFFQYIFSKKP